MSSSPWWTIWLWTHKSQTNLPLSFKLPYQGTLPRIKKVTKISADERNHNGWIIKCYSVLSPQLLFLSWLLVYHVEKNCLHCTIWPTWCSAQFHGAEWPLVKTLWNDDPKCISSFQPSYQVLLSWQRELTVLVSFDCQVLELSSWHSLETSE